MAERTSRARTMMRRTASWVVSLSSMRATMRETRAEWLRTRRPWASWRRPHTEKSRWSKLPFQVGGEDEGRESGVVGLPVLEGPAHHVEEIPRGNVLAEEESQATLGFQDVEARGVVEGELRGAVDAVQDESVGGHVPTTSGEAFLNVERFRKIGLWADVPGFPVGVELWVVQRGWNSRKVGQ